MRNNVSIFFAAGVLLAVFGTAQARKNAESDTSTSMHLKSGEVRTFTAARQAAVFTCRVGEKPKADLKMDDDGGKIIKVHFSCPGENGKAKNATVYAAAGMSINLIPLCRALADGTLVTYGICGSESSARLRPDGYLALNSGAMTVAVAKE